MVSTDHDVADIGFDDLTSPRLTDVQRQILEFTEARPVELDIDRMLAEAVDQAGGDFLLEPLLLLGGRPVLGGDDLRVPDVELPVRAEVSIESPIGMRFANISEISGKP